MSTLEAHPIADVSGEVSGEDVLHQTALSEREQEDVTGRESPGDPDAPEEVVASIDAQAPEDADAPVDAQVPGVVRAPVDSHVLPDTLDYGTKATVVQEGISKAALPPKAPQSKVQPKRSNAEVASMRHEEAQAPQLQFSRIPSSGRFRAKDGVSRPRTFTARPPEGCTRHINRADYTHSEARLVDIARETRSLVTRLERIYGRHVGSAIAANSPPRGKPCNEAPTHRNRRLFSEKIAAENLQIYNRLQAVKPSKDTAAAQLRREWATAQKYARNCSQNHVRRLKRRSPSQRVKRTAPSHAGTNMAYSAELATKLHVTVPSTLNVPEPAAAQSHPIGLDA